MTAFCRYQFSVFIIALLLKSVCQINEYGLTMPQEAYTATMLLVVFVLD